MAVRATAEGRVSDRDLSVRSGNGRRRAMIDSVRPCVDGGAFAVKRVVGERLDVEADVFVDGHDRLACELEWRDVGGGVGRGGGEGGGGGRGWMRGGENDVWRGSFTPTEVGRWRFRVRAWVDEFGTWLSDLAKRVEAGSVSDADLEIGSALVSGGVGRASGDAASSLRSWRERLTGSGSASARASAALESDLGVLMRRVSDDSLSVCSAWVDVEVERRRALFSAWYELFPRSASPERGRHGTLRDVEGLLDDIAGMGFDVLYLPPVHPIGRTARKGRNNATEAAADDVGSCWAIGAREGGHTSIHPALGTLDDFDRLVESASSRGIDLAMDIAFQCAPDHPWVTAHPEWFRHRPDGTIQYAENPPKKYQDIVPFDFECEAWESLWESLLGVVRFWIDRGVRVFRVDNPHTKPFRFWDWLIGEVRRDHPEVIFLSEAFTRPKKLYRLAKGGFSQSYTYFSWRTSPDALRAYVEELASSPVGEFCRPNFWPNTPDILTEQLQEGGRPAAMMRLVLAATLSSSYGIYGPVYELCDFSARGPGVEENLNSEKYEVRHWNRDDPWSLRHFIGLVNRIRRENAALQQFRDVTFHHCDDGAHLAYSKRDASGGNVVLCVVNTDVRAERWGQVRLDLGAMGLSGDAMFVVDDLLTGIRRRWTGSDHWIGLGPGESHIFRVSGGVRTERDYGMWA